jgi:hypothetical protein
MDWRLSQNPLIHPLPNNGQVNIDTLPEFEIKGPCNGSILLEVIKNKTSKIKETFAYAKRIYRALPFFVRLVFRPVKKIYWLLGVLRVDFWILQGNEITSKQKLDILYGGTEENRHFLTMLAFDRSYKEKYIGKAWLWNISKILKEKVHDDSIVITEVPKILRKLFNKWNYLYIPSWVDGEVDVFSPIKSDSLQADLRRIKKNKLSFEVTNDLNQFHNFYHNMHLPYITKAFGNRGVILSYDFMKSEFGKHGLYNDLLLIKKEEEYIAGMLLGYSKKGVYLHPLGVKDGNPDYVKDGAIGALFYFSLMVSKEKGYKKVNFGLTRAFLKDGVFQFKKKRGMQIAGTSNMGFALKRSSTSAAVRGFFLSNPFLYMDKMGFNGAVFIDNDQSLSVGDFERIYKDYYLSGICKLFIYRFGKGDHKTQEIVFPILLAA